MIVFRMLAVKMSRGMLEDLAGAIIFRNAVSSKVLCTIASLICVSAALLSMREVL